MYPPDDLEDFMVLTNSEEKKQKAQRRQREKLRDNFIMFIACQGLFF